MRTALRSEKPSDASRCDTWSVPPFDALRPASRRSTSTKPVSKSGTIEDQHHEHRGADEGDLRPQHRHERRRAEHGADEQAPRIAHEEARRRAVPEQEPGERAGQHDEQQHESGPERRDQQRGQEQRGDQRHAGGETVHVVEQVHRVAQARRTTPWPRSVSVKRDRAGGRGAGEEKDEERADGERRHQLGQRRQLQAIVEDADAAHGERRQQHRRPRARRNPPRPAATRNDERRRPAWRRQSPPRPSSASAGCASDRAAAARRRRSTPTASASPPPAGSRRRAPSGSRPPADRTGVPASISSRRDRSTARPGRS